MIITYFRSSSYNAHTDCSMRYFLEYNLGWRGSANFAADKGTLVHKILEIMAVAKKGLQDGKKTITDEIVGKIKTSKYNLDKIIEVVYNYYSKLWSQHPWTDKTFKEVQKLVYDAISICDGAFNPQNRTILEPEQRFDFIIDKDWALYSYDIPGEGKTEGKLALKGTIDLITEISPGIIEIVDYKTGARKNWTTGEEKTYEKLCSDPQLMLYYYAAKHLYPNAEQIMITIFFIKDGGPFTVTFSDDDIPTIENMIREKFNKIKATRNPPLNKTWKCKKLCPFGKNDFSTITEDSEVKPITEFRAGQQSPRGTHMTCCSQVEFELQRKGMEKVIEEYKHPEHLIGMYHAPGGLG